MAQARTPSHQQQRRREAHRQTLEYPSASIGASTILNIAETDVAAAKINATNIPFPGLGKYNYAGIPSEATFSFTLQRPTMTKPMFIGLYFQQSLAAGKCRRSDGAWRVLVPAGWSPNGFPRQLTVRVMSGTPTASAASSPRGTCGCGTLRVKSHDTTDHASNETCRKPNAFGLRRARVSVGGNARRSYEHPS